MDDLGELEDTKDLHIWQPLLGIYPYILIQFEPFDGTYRIGVDYGLMDDQEVIATLKHVIEEAVGTP